MIAYDLQCGNRHTFEGWFEDARAYETQLKKGLISCPLCNETTITRIPSTFAIKSSQAASGDDPNTPDLTEVSQKIVDYVEKNFDNVGSDFAKEALKIHYGVTEPRNIRGVSTKQEEETLQDEGIDFFKVPIPPRPDSDV